MLYFDKLRIMGIKNEGGGYLLLDWIVYAIAGMAILGGIYQLFNLIIGVEYASGWKTAFHTFVLIALVVLAGIMQYYSPKIRDASVICFIVYAAGLLVHKHFISVEKES